MPDVLYPEVDEKLFNELRERIETLCKMIGGGHQCDVLDEQLLAAPSLIPVCNTPEIENTQILTIDIGGTNTKAAVREVVNKTVIWRELLNFKNDDLNCHSKGKGLIRMANSVAKEVLSSLIALGLTPEDIKGVGVVWSNSLESRELVREGVKGVTGLVLGAHSDFAYQKGEWWNSDIEDGDDVGNIFLDALSRKGINPQAFTMANDTIFVCKSVVGADAGVVASTGTNSTIVPQGSKILCNTECGNSVSLPAGLIGLDKERRYKLEEVSAGRGIPVVLEDFIRLNLRRFPRGPFSVLGPLIEKADHYQKPIFDGREVSSLSFGELDVLTFEDEEVQLGEEEISYLRTMVTRLLEISGRFAALVAYLSIYNQLCEKREFLVAFDSTQARYQYGYFSSMKKHLAALLSPFQCSARIELLQPQGNVSIPQMGAARAANDLLAN